jgi:hypothetical protein
MIVTLNYFSARGTFKKFDEMHVIRPEMHEMAHEIFQKNIK